MKVNELAREFGMQIHELRAFSDDLLNDCTSDYDEVSDRTEKILREAIASAPTRE